MERGDPQESGEGDRLVALREKEGAWRDGEPLNPREC